MTDIYEYVEKRIGGLRKFERRFKDYDQRKLYDEVFDSTTLFTLYKLFHKVLKIIEFPIATGKEANIFRAVTQNDELVAVKIYRIANTTFRNLAQYIQGDPRFKYVRGNLRNLITLWARKEYKNLELMSSAGIRVPTPYFYKDNVLVMEYIGNKTVPAPMLFEVELEAPNSFCQTLLRNIRRMYCKTKLIHADLSEYNILVHRRKPVIIDVAQAVVVDHPQAIEYFQRDIHNLTRYFRTKLKLNISESEVYDYVTGNTKLLPNL